jgi:hypothetical protein
MLTKSVVFITSDQEEYGDFDDAIAHERECLANNMVWDVASALRDVENLLPTDNSGSIISFFDR